MASTKWSDLRKRRQYDAGVRDGYAAARNSYRLAERVRALREARGLSQEDLAGRMRTKQSVISRLEGGGTKPSLQTLERLSKALDVGLVVEFEETIRPAQPAIAAAIEAARQVVRSRSRVIPQVRAKKAARRKR